MNHPKTFSIVSLGCPKNLVDSEHYVQDLERQGLQFQVDVDGSDLVVLNTCGFLESARNEAREYIEALVELKQNGRIREIVVRGCMPQFEGIDRLVDEFPDVNHWYGIPGGAAAVPKDAPKNVSETVPMAWTPEPVVLSERKTLLTESHVAYLRIADGCDRRCTFCAIPTIRGRFRSVPMEDVLKEANRLAEMGVKELVVIAQETTFWGTDLYGKPRLVELLRELEKIDGVRWIRLMYSYPLFFGDDLIDLFVAGGKLVPYIDIPLQHANDEMLRRMNRRVDRTETEQLLDKLRSRIDRLVLRTSLIVGFPGETDAMFEELLKFVEKWKFERAGVFPYSAEKGTQAASLDDRVAPRIVEKRYDRLYKACEKHSIAWATKQKGNILDVQIDRNYMDESGRREPHLFIGRTMFDAPDIDPVVYVTGTLLEPGSIQPCEILETEGCDLVAVVVE